jgi:hypothetical protein
MVAIGPIWPEQADFEAHKPVRDQMAALERAIADELRQRGYVVLGTLREWALLISPCCSNFGRCSIPSSRSSPSDERRDAAATTAIPGLLGTFLLCTYICQYKRGLYAQNRRETDS